MIPITRIVTTWIIFWVSTGFVALFSIVSAIHPRIIFNILIALFGLIVAFAGMWLGKLKAAKDSPRCLSPGQMKRLSPLLPEVKLPPQFNIEYEVNDLESGAYIDQLAKFLCSKCGRSAPIVLAIGRMRTAIGIPTDLTIVVKDKENIPEPAKKLFQALETVKIPISFLNRDSLKLDEFVLSAGKKPI